MTDVFKLFARHNKDINAKLIKILARLPEEELSKDRKSYYKSLTGLFLHLMDAAGYLLNMVRKFSEEKYCNYLYTASDFKISTKIGFQEAATYLTKYDLCLLELAETITENDLYIKKCNTIYNRKEVEVCI